MPSRWILSAVAALPIPAAIAFSVPARAAVPECSALVRSNGEEICRELDQDGPHGTRRICPSDLVPTPGWKGPGTAEPPLTREAAGEAARKALERMPLRTAGWEIALTQVREACRGRWYYLTTWRSKQQHGTSVRIAVSMDGKALVDSKRPAASRTPGEAGTGSRKCRAGEIFTPGGCAIPPLQVTRVPPAYPEQARKDGVEGKVILAFMVFRDGSIGEVKILKEEPQGYGFAEEAIRMVKAAPWRPAHRNGDPFDHMKTHVVDWKLK